MKRLSNIKNHALIVICLVCLPLFSNSNAEVGDQTKACRSEVIKDFRLKKLSRQEVRQRLQDCKKSNDSHHRKCKRIALQQANGDRERYTRLADFCIAQQTEVTKVFPFSIDSASQTLSSGNTTLGQSASINAYTRTLKDFDCSHLRQALSDNSSAEYLLFGNHPRHFRGWSSITPDRIRNWAKQGTHRRQGTSTFSDIQGTGRLYFGKANGPPLLVFPSGHCIANPPHSDSLESLRHSFLLDRVNKLVTPYFTVAFYSESLSNAVTREVLNQLEVSLGSDYKVMHEKPGMAFYARAPIYHTDDEGDPRDVCQKPRQHGFIAVVKYRANSERLEYVLIVDVPTLCQHGDVLSNYID